MLCCGYVLRDQVGLSDPSITGVLDRLKSGGYIRRDKLTKEEKRLRFPSDSGYRAIVVLTREGEAKIEEFKEKMGRLLGKIAGGGKTSLRVLVKQTVLLAKMILRRHVGG